MSCHWRFTFARRSRGVPRRWEVVKANVATASELKMFFLLRWGWGRKGAGRGETTVGAAQICSFRGTARFRLRGIAKEDRTLSKSFKIKIITWTNNDSEWKAKKCTSTQKCAGEGRQWGERKIRYRVALQEPTAQEMVVLYVKDNRTIRTTRISFGFLPESTLKSTGSPTSQDFQMCKYIMD